jgi:hypothetical protein
MPSNINFKAVQSISRLRTWLQSLTKRPASNRFAQMQKPERSKYSTRICVARRLMNTYSPPSHGSSRSPWRTNPCKPSKLLRLCGEPHKRNYVDLAIMLMVTVITVTFPFLFNSLRFQDRAILAA